MVKVFGPPLSKIGKSESMPSTSQLPFQMGQFGADSESLLRRMGRNRRIQAEIGNAERPSNL